MTTITDKVNLALITAVAGGVIWITTTFVKADEFHKQITDINVSVAYGQYYDRLDDYDEAVEEENEELAKEYMRQMEKLKAEICEHDPEWERCKKK